MKIPTIHLNGNSGESLLRELEEASKALQKAREALSNITIHGRNYYPQGEAALPEAQDEFRAMMRRFDSVATEVNDYHLAIWELTK